MTLARDDAARGQHVTERLPLAQLPTDVSCMPAQTSAALDLPRGHGERVLYLDDDEVMKTVVAALLERWGYQVTTAGDAAEALGLFSSEPLCFALVKWTEGCGHPSGGRH